MFIRIKIQNGFSLAEMLVTMSIMITLGAVGSTRISYLKNYLLVNDAQEKIETVIKNVKKDVLNGVSTCGKINFKTSLISNQVNASFFYTEKWSSTINKVNKFSCIHTQDSKKTIGMVQDITLNKENVLIQFQENNSDSLVNIQVFDPLFNEIYSKDFSKSISLKGKKIKLPFNKNEYIIKINDENNLYTLNTINIYFFNANKTMIENNDPSIIHINNIQGKSLSQEIKTGNLNIVFSAPYAKGEMLITDNNNDFLVKNILVEFSNENEAEGSYELFNANLIAEEQTIVVSQINTCSFSQIELKFSCF